MRNPIFSESQVYQEIGFSIKTHFVCPCTTYISQ
eukprot:UN22724